jgi:hypothetical protein
VERKRADADVRKQKDFRASRGLLYARFIMRDAARPKAFNRRGVTGVARSPELELSDSPQALINAESKALSC